MADALTERPYSGTILSDAEKLAELDAALSTIRQTGQSYTLFGSEAVTFADYDRLSREASQLRARLAARTGRTYANFEGAL